MIKLLLSGFLLFLCPHFALAGPGDTILWSGNRLAWSNYKGNYDTAVYNRIYLATTSWKLVYQYRLLLSQNKLQFIIYAWFDAKKSWMQPRTQNDKNLLQHEQGHFDLAELLARHFRQQLSQTVFSRSNYRDSINAIFGKLLSAAYATHKRYDTETNHGMNIKRQASWLRFIATELEKLNDYTNINMAARLAN